MKASGSTCEISSANEVNLVPFVVDHLKNVSCMQVALWMNGLDKRNFAVNERAPTIFMLYGLVMTARQLTFVSNVATVIICHSDM